MRFSEVPTETAQGNISAETWQTAEVDGKVFGAPVIRGNHLMLFYNRSLIDKPATTWAELSEQHKRLKKTSIETIAWNFNEMFFFMPFFGAMGGWPVTEGKLTLNTPAMVMALKAYRTLSDTGLVDRSCNYDCAMNRFKGGTLAYTINGDWAFKEFQDALKDNLGIALLPSWKGNTLIPMFSTHVLVFPDNSLTSSKKDSLMRFTKYMQSYEVQNRLWQELTVFPVEERAYTQAINDIEPEVQGILNQLNQAKAMPSDRAMSYAWGAMTKGYNRYMHDVITAEEAAALMQKLAERELAKD